MKAIQRRWAGSPDQLHLIDVPTPAPVGNEILVRVHATSVTRGDAVMRKLPRWVARLVGETPKSIPGFEFAGEVEETGDSVTGYAVGDRVFGTTAGLKAGSHAEYLCVPEDGIVAHTPAEIEDDEAAAIPVGAMTALHFLREAGVRHGQRVLVTGASGSVGSYAVQIARHMGAHVTGVTSTSNTDLVVSLGADEVIDYTERDFTEGAETFDVIFDAAGKSTAKRAAAVLAEGGRFVTTRTRRRERVEDLLCVRDMVAGGVLRPIIERTFRLDEIADAHRYVETGHKRGNLVVVVVPG